MSQSTRVLFIALSSSHRKVLGTTGRRSKKTGKSILGQSGGPQSGGEPVLRTKGKAYELHRSKVADQGQAIEK